MRRIGASFGLILAIGAAPLAGCGRDKVERGLAPASETDTPTSQKADQETAQQRQQQLTEDMQKQQEKEFDKNDAGEKPAQ